MKKSIIFSFQLFTVSFLAIDHFPHEKLRIFPVCLCEKAFSSRLRNQINDTNEKKKTFI